MAFAPENAGPMKFTTATISASAFKVWEESAVSVPSALLVLNPLLMALAAPTAVPMRS
jgi:hypothetical protein